MAYPYDNLLGYREATIAPPMPQPQQMGAYDPSLWEQMRWGLADKLSLLGLDPRFARRQSEGLLGGGTTAIGLADVLPFASTPRAVHDLQAASGVWPTALAALGVGLSALPFGGAGRGAARAALPKGLQIRPPPKNPVALLPAQQQETLPPKLLDRLEALRATQPAVAEATEYLRPIEAQSVLQSQANIDSFAHMLDFLPKASNYAALAKFGSPKRGWYAASANAIQNVFGIDAPRFTALLAATSPQNSVEMNLLNTVNIWKNWTAAGRPTDAASIKTIMGQSVAGQKLEDSVLDAWVNNSVRALGSKDPASVVLSGPKVDSFFHNLMGDVVRVTNDAHMANISGVSQDLLRVSPSEKQLAAGNPGLSQLYNAMTSRVRQGGDIARMVPAEAQETIWSVALPLTRMQERLGIPAREIIERGLLTADDIRGSPDFSSLLRQDTYADPLRDAGYGDALDALVPYNWGPAKIPRLTIPEQQEIMDAGARLEQLSERRARQTRARAQPRAAPESAFVYSTAEAVPGEGIGHLENLLGARPSQRQHYTSAVSSALRDPLNRDVIHQSLGLPTVATTPMQGAYRATPTSPIEYNPGFAAGVELPLTKAGQLRQADEQALRTAATIRGALTAQHGSPFSGLVKDERGADVLVPKKKQMTDAEARAFIDRYGIEDFALADTGQGVNVLNWGDPLSDTQVKEIGGLLGVVDKGESVAARNVARPEMNYVDLQSEWLQPPGSRAVATRVLDELDKLSATKVRKVDSKQLREAAAKLHKKYGSASKKFGPVREDLMNLLKIVADKGLKGLRDAVGRKEFLPSIAAIGLAPTVFRLSSQGEGSSGE